MSARNKTKVLRSQSDARQQLIKQAQTSGGNEGANYDRIFEQRRNNENQRQSQIRQQRLLQLEKQQKIQSQQQRKNQQNLQNRQGFISDSNDLHNILLQGLQEKDERILNDTSYKFQLNENTGNASDLKNVGVSDFYFYIDSSNPLVSTFDGKIQFLLSNLSSIEPLENIIEIEISDLTIELPANRERILQAISQTSFQGINITTQFYTKTLGILIDELSSQAILESDNNKFHFLFKVTDIDKFDQFGHRVNLKGMISKYIFRKPIRSLESMTFILKDPINQIAIGEDDLTAYLQIRRDLDSPVNQSNRLYLWLPDVENTTKEYIPGESYYIQFVDIDSITGLFDIGPGRTLESYKNQLLDSSGYIARFKVTRVVDSVETGGIEPPLVLTEMGNTQFTVEPPNPITGKSRSIPPYQPFTSDSNTVTGNVLFNIPEEISVKYKYYTYLDVDNIDYIDKNYAFYSKYADTLFPYKNIFKYEADISKDFYKVTIRVLHKRVNFGLRIRTLRDTRTNNIIPT